MANHLFCLFSFLIQGGIMNNEWSSLNINYNNSIDHWELVLKELEAIEGEE